jgi:lipopolysaccharide transport system ATP-binding protein
LILVSHDHELVRNLTSRALLLECGKVLFWGSTREATHRYRKILYEQEALRLAKEEPAATRPVTSTLHENEGEFGIGGAKIVDLRILGSDGEPRTLFQTGERMDFEMSVLIEAPLDQLNFAIVIKTLQGWKVYSWGTLNQDIAVWSGRQEGEIIWEKSFQPGHEAIVTLSLEGNLGAGAYEVQAVVSRELGRQYGSQQILHWRDEIGSFRVEMNQHEYFFGGVCDLHGKATLHG